MAINPAFARVSNFDVPSYPNMGARVDPSVFANLGSLGEAIGNRREQDALAGIMASATDASGKLDLNKAATALALSGRDPLKYINALTLQKGEAAREAASEALAEYHRTMTGLTKQQRDLEKRKFEEGTVQIETPSMLRPGGYYIKKPGEAPTFTPFPASQTPGPQSAIEPEQGAPGAPQLAAAAATPQQLALPLETNPEEAPPYRVAGPPMPPPTPAPAVEISRAEKTTPQFNEKYLATLPTEAARTVVKGVANYELDPGQFTGKDREDILAAAKLYRPDYNQTEFQKRQTPPGAEVQARVGLGKAFIDRAPNIRARIQDDELASIQGKTLAMLGQGGPGELRRAIDEGAEALLRGLTGAGMNKDEAANYVRRYQWGLIDTKETSLRKLNELENALRYVSTEVGKGRGGEDLLKDFKSTYGQPIEMVRKVTSDKEVNDLVGRGKAALDAAPNPEARSAAVSKVHRILQERGVPPQFWPQ